MPALRLIRAALAAAAAGLSLASCAPARPAAGPGPSDPEGQMLADFKPRADLDSYRSWVGPAPLEPPPAAFAVREIDGRWWLLAPSGRRFWASALRHAGCGMEQDEPVTPYRDALLRKWGPDALLTKCQTRTLERLLGWGFSAIGTRSSASLMRWNRLPYLTKGLDPAGLAVPLAAPGIPDAFLGDLMTRLVPGVPPLNDWKDSPFCIGHPAGVRADWNGLPDGVLALPAAAPAKADWIRTLRIRYPTVAALDLAWGVSATSFETLRWPGDAKATAAARRDLADFRGRFADWLYLTMGQAIRFSDNAHMIFGVCVVPGVTPPEVAATIAKRTDVVVVEIANAEAGLPAVAKLAVELGRPLYVVAGVAAAAGPAELPAAWSRAMERLAAIPGVVGAEIADYLPNADGTSFVHWDDIPEITLTEAARRTNARLLRIHAEGHAEGHI